MVESHSSQFPHNMRHGGKTAQCLESKTQRDSDLPSHVTHNSTFQFPKSCQSSSATAKPGNAFHWVVELICEFYEGFIRNRDYSNEIYKKKKSNPANQYIQSPACFFNYTFSPKL